ncbi:MAG: glycosyltransferase [Pleurocapsa sp. MO_192.B19]|nr:glycosyltransferase [Pleurocapsa sp. MO_192.B19]
MKITILALGTRGDVQPYIALGLGLQAAGHEVTLASLELFQNFVTDYGLEFASLGSVSEEFRKRSMQEAKRNTIPFHGLFGRVRFWSLFCSFLEPLMVNTWNICQGTETIIYSRLTLTGYHIAESLRVPGIAAYTNPLTPTQAFPNPLCTLDFRLDGTLNWLTHVLEGQFRWQFARKKINQWREQTLKLPPVNITGVYRRQQKQQIPILHCYSPAVVPKPPDWPERAYVTGYWFLDPSPEWQAPKELLDFLAAGPPPVYIGFGSMTGTNPEALTELVLAAITQTGQRGILLTGWGALSNADFLPDNVFKIDSVPHDWLFPKMAAVVHHGGAGTTAAGLRAGVPSILIPFGADQPFWGQRVAELGVGTKPLPRKKLTVERLAAAIRTVTTDQAMKARASALGEKIRSEDGITRAVELFHRYLPSHSRS